MEADAILPPSVKLTESSVRRVARDVARGLDATDRAGEGCGRLETLRLIVECGGYFSESGATMEADAVHPPLLELNQIERTSSCP